MNINLICFSFFPPCFPIILQWEFIYSYEAPQGRREAFFVRKSLAAIKHSWYDTHSNILDKNLFFGGIKFHFVLPPLFSELVIFLFFKYTIAFLRTYCQSYINLCTDLSTRRSKFFFFDRVGKRLERDRLKKKTDQLKKGAKKMSGDAR